MSKTITIEPVTRIEGHAKVHVDLDDNGNVLDARMNVVEFRGLEKICEGRLFWEMPILVERACGICPVSHHLAAAKACDDLLKIEIPYTGKLIRELMHMGQTIQSHALHFFYLAFPDFIFGPDIEIAKRSIVGIVEEQKVLAEKAIMLRAIGQRIIEKTGGRRIHPVNAIPGGVATPLTEEDRDSMLTEIDNAIGLSKIAIKIAKEFFEANEVMIKSFGSPKTHYMSLVKNDSLELYDGTLRIISPNGNIVEDFHPSDYLKHIGERTESWTYLKFPYYKKLGYPEGIYRVAPLARLNIAKNIPTTLANQELIEFKRLTNNDINHNTLYFHLARLIELLYASERAKQILEDNEILSKVVRIKVERNEGEGIGCIEAPRGTLIHHYVTNKNGIVVKANLIVATTNNNLGMNLSIKEVAKNYIKNGNISNNILDRVEMAIRCYDPCLSCATHATGQIPISLKIYNDKKELVFTKHSEVGTWI